jgi:hypothetical protein
MTNQQRPITPPPELVQQWFATWESSDNEEMSFAEFAIPSAAQWGADQELEACCADIHSVHGRTVANWLRAIRRPKPPSLKEQALEALEVLNQTWTMPKELDAVITIRRALEALPND